jgi:hypothetical protein
MLCCNAEVKTEEESEAAHFSGVWRLKRYRGSHGQSRTPHQQQVTTVDQHSISSLFFMSNIISMVKGKKSTSILDSTHAV